MQYRIQETVIENIKEAPNPPIILRHEHFYKYHHVIGSYLAPHYPIMPPSKPVLHIASNTLYALNRLYAYWSFLVNYTLYTSLWLLGGIPPNVDARVNKEKEWHPAVFVAMAEGDVGTETVFLLANKGYTVFAAVQSDEHGAAMMKGLSKAGGSVRPIVCDLSPGSIHRAFDEIRQFGEQNTSRRLVSVVVNVGACPVSPLEYMTDQEINVRPLPCLPHFPSPRITDPLSQETISHNLTTPITIARAFIPLLTATPSQKRIILLSSFSGYAPLPGSSLFSALAASVDSLARGMTMELTPRGVRTTVVRTGSVRGSAPRLRKEKSRGYEGLMRCWRGIIRWMELGTPARHVAQQVHDALVCVFFLFMILSPRGV